MADRRLRQAEPLGGAGEVQAVRDRQETLKLCGIQTKHLQKIAVISYDSKML